MAVVLILLSYDGCSGGVMFCGWELYVWICAAPWTLPFIFSGDSQLLYYGLFALTAIGAGLNVTILYFVGRAIDRWLRKFELGPGAPPK